MIDHRVNFPFHTQLPFEIRLKLLCSDENLSNLHKTLDRRAVGLRTGRLDRKRLQIRFQSPVIFGIKNHVGVFHLDESNSLDELDQSQETAVSS
ncbi:hypothetical protein T08_14989 [Trichinella sp. T8]|uniref:Uncharacterized protein n=1 Tax=Trichinella murrelli TaxID=144512 RepID=A0A0V0TXB1_9BILA|nr:hypothetical protein T05_11660 [Trichinella murrelli]KRZ86403.1 hypothetical protein T08_14989 [Trichinella sp. T8]